MREGSGRIGTGGIRIQIEANPKLENRNSKLEKRQFGRAARGCAALFHFGTASGGTGWRGLELLAAALAEAADRP